MAFVYDDGGTSYADSRGSLRHLVLYPIYTMIETFMY